MAHDRLSRLRSLLFRAPSVLVWGGVCRELEAWWSSGEGGLRVGLEYALGHLESWPDALRVAPWSWWGRVRRGDVWACWEVVRALCLQGMFLNDTDLGAVVSVGCLKSVSVLDVSDNRIGPSGVRNMVRSEGVRALKTLDISNNFLGDAGVDVLVEGGFGLCLGKLDISHNHIGDYGVGELARWCVEDVESLGVLDLSGNAVGVEGVSRLVGAGLVDRVDGLGLSDNKVGAEGVRVLSRNACGLSLRDLRLDGNGIGDRGLEGLAQWSCPRLSALSMRHNGVTSVGVEALVEAPWMSGVKRVELGFNRIGDRGALALADWIRSDACRVEVLDVRYNRIGDAGARGLLDAVMHRKRKCRVILHRNPCSREMLDDSGAKAREMQPFDDVDDFHKVKLINSFHGLL